MYNETEVVVVRRIKMSTLTAPPTVAEPELAEEERQQKMWDYYGSCGILHGALAPALAP